MPNSSCESQLYKTISIEYEDPLDVRLPACYFRSKENDADSQDNAYARCVLHDANEGQTGCKGLVQQVGVAEARSPKPNNTHRTRFGVLSLLGKFVNVSQMLAQGEMNGIQHIFLKRLITYYTVDTIR